MPKQGRSDQHQLLHFHWPGNCCLCFLEDEKETTYKLLKRALTRIDRQAEGGLLLIEDIKEHLLRE
jgi:hypothetical protein